MQATALGDSLVETIFLISTVVDLIDYFVRFVGLDYLPNFYCCRLEYEKMVQLSPGRPLRHYYCSDVRGKPLYALLTGLGK